MKKASSESRINAVSAVKVVLTFGDPRTPAVSADVALLHQKDKDTPVLFGKTELSTTWPANIRKLANELHAAIEDHLLHVYFSNEGKKDANGRGNYPIAVPTGLGGSGLVDSEDGPEQL
jgi:hypothetical protein